MSAYSGSSDGDDRTNSWLGESDEDPIGSDVAARLAGLAEGAYPLTPLEGEFGNGVVAVYFAGADVEELREARKQLAAHPTWALLVLAPSIAPWVVASREVCAFSIAGALELMASEAPPPQKMLCVVGAVHLLASHDAVSDSHRSLAVAAAARLVVQGAQAASEVMIYAPNRGDTNAGKSATLDGLAAGALAAVKAATDGEAMAALVVAGAEEGIALAVIGAPGVPDDEVTDRTGSVLKMAIPGGVLVRQPPAGWAPA